MEQERQRFDKKEQFRLFEEELDKARQIVLHARDKDGFRKFENRSHFYRCAVMKMIREELAEIEIKKGRPKKYED